MCSYHARHLVENHRRSVILTATCYHFNVAYMLQPTFAHLRRLFYRDRCKRSFLFENFKRWTAWLKWQSERLSFLLQTYMVDKFTIFSMSIFILIIDSDKKNQFQNNFTINIKRNHNYFVSYFRGFRANRLSVTAR